MFDFMRCVPEAVVENGVGGLIAMVPGGAFAVKVAGGALAKYRQRKKDDALRAEMAELAAAGVADARAAAEEVAREVAAAAGADERAALAGYLAGIPAAVNQSFRRPTDPGGKTVPSKFALTTPEAMLRLLPARPPRFRPGAPLPEHPKWVLDRVLGVGGFGEVWLARHTETGMEGAVKFCHGEQAADLRHEGRVITQVMRAGDHPSVVALRDAVLTGDTPWLRFDYVAGGDLGDVIRRLRGHPPEVRVAQTVAAVRWVAAAVGRFHRLSPPVVHRDLKPTNILYDGQTKRLRVTDFGIGAVTARAALAEEARGAATAGGRMLTTHRGSHTPLYASPQQRDGHDPDPRDDVHALGVIAYQMLTGDVTKAPGVDYAHDLRDAGAAGALIDLVGRCVAQNPDRRPRDAAAVAEALAPAAVPPPLAPPPPDPVSRPEPVSPPPVDAATVAVPTADPVGGPTPAADPDPPASAPLPQPDRELEVNVSGRWRMNRVAKPFAQWKSVTQLPAKVTVRHGEVYQLSVKKGAKDEDVRGLAALVGVEALAELDLTGCKRFTAAGFVHATQLTQLRTLLAGKSAASDEILKLFARLSRLERLALDETAVTDAGLTHLRPLKALTALSLAQTAVTDAGMERVAALRKLSSLDLNFTKVTDAGLPALSGLRQLESLGLAGTAVTDAGLGHVLAFDKLRNLNLADTAVTEVGIAQVATMKKIEWLWLIGCKAVTDRTAALAANMRSLTGLDVAATGVTDAGLAHLRRAPKLAALHLGECPGVTDAGLEHLAAMPGLAEVELDGTAATVAGVNRLRAALPRCRVRFAAADDFALADDVLSGTAGDPPEGE